MTNQPAPCDGGSCEDYTERLTIALEDLAAAHGFTLLYCGLRHDACGRERASSTEARRLMRRVMRDRARLFAVVVEVTPTR